MYFRGAGYDNTVKDTIIHYFEKNGVKKDRLLFAKKTSRKDFLASYKNVDICLDPFPIQVEPQHVKPYGWGFQ